MGGVKPLYTSTAHAAYRLESSRVLLKTPHAAPAARPGPSGISSSGVGPGSVSSPQEPNVQAEDPCSATRQAPPKGESPCTPTGCLLGASDLTKAVMRVKGEEASQNRKLHKG